MSKSLLSLIPAFTAAGASLFVASAAYAQGAPLSEMDSRASYCLGLLGSGLAALETCANNPHVSPDQKQSCSSDAISTKQAYLRDQNYLAPREQNPTLAAAIKQQGDRGATDAQRLLACHDPASCKPVNDCFDLIGSLPELPPTPTAPLNQSGQ